MEPFEANTPVVLRRPFRLGLHVSTVVVIAAYLLLAISFARVQTLWIDETTQLSGLTLTPIEQLHWLAGDQADRFGVPADRQPPLSYLFGWTWSRVFGLTPMSMRAFGVSMVALAGLFVMLAGFRLSGPLGAPLAGALFLLSPNVLSMAPEIRPYPLFLLWAAIGLWCLTEYASRPKANRSPWLIGLTATCIAASYTHFFGCIMSAAMLGAVLFVTWRDREPIRPILLAGAVYTVAIIGILPFVLFAGTISRPHDVHGLSGMIRMLYRLIGNPALSVDRAALAVMMAGAFGLFLLSLARLFTPHNRNRADRAIFIVLSLGIGIPLVAGFVIHSFNAFSPNYNIWLLPALAVFLTLGMRLYRSDGSGRRFVQAASAGAACLALIWSSWVFVENGPVFTHGPHSLVRATVKKYGTDSVVIYENTPSWGFGYFPLRFDFGPTLAQARVAPEPGGVPCCRVEKINHRQAETLASMTSGRNTVIVARFEQMGANDLRHHLRDKPIKLAEGPLATKLAASPGWRHVESDQYIAFVSARLDVFTRRQRP